MDQATMITMGASVATNIIFVKWKIEKERYSDALLDGIIFIGLVYLFSRTVSGLSIATLAASFVSFYLYFSPPKEFFKFNINSLEKRKNNKRPNKEIWEEWKKEDVDGEWDKSWEV